MGDAEPFCTLFFKIQTDIKKIWDNTDKAKNELIARDPVFYQKTLFRAFLHNDDVKQKKKIKFCIEFKKIKKPNEFEKYINDKIKEGFEFIKRQNVLMSLIFPMYGIYIFKKEIITEEDTMTYQKYMDYQVMLKEALKILHAPYLNSSE